MLTLRDFLEDVVGFRRPDERLRIGVVLADVVVDRGDEFGDVAEGAAADPLARDLGEEPLDQIARPI